MEARAAVDRDRVLGLFSRVAVGHIYVVGCVRQRLDVHKYMKVSHSLHGCWILTQ